MPPQPKRKLAKAHQGKRRSHIAASAPATITCPQCNSTMQPHHACPTCGTYKGREVKEIKSPKPKAS